MDCESPFVINVNILPPEITGPSLRSSFLFKRKGHVELEPVLRHGQKEIYVIKLNRLHTICDRKIGTKERIVLRRGVTVI